MVRVSVEQSVNGAGPMIVTAYLGSESVNLFAFCCMYSRTRSIYPSLSYSFSLSFLRFRIILFFCCENLVEVLRRYHYVCMYISARCSEAHSSRFLTSGEENILEFRANGILSRQEGTGHGHRKVSSFLLERCSLLVLMLLPVCSASSTYFLAQATQTHE